MNHIVKHYILSILVVDEVVANEISYQFHIKHNVYNVGIYIPTQLNI